MENFIFCTVYLAPDSAPYSAPYSVPYSVLVVLPSLTTTDHAIIFTQDTLHSSFISKKSLRFPSHKFLETSPFYHMPTCFYNCEVCNID